MPTTHPTLPAVGEGLAARWIGRVIDGRYRIVELLGEGGMGAVFVAEHLKLRKQVALKTIRAEFAANSQAEARFTREALATAQLDHPHVASAIDYGHLPEGGAYLVTQLVRGTSLSKRLEQGPLSWPQACQLGSQIADALAAAHALKIVHRDLKPDNILLEQRGDGSLHARVVDFGIARVSGELGGGVADTAQPLTRMGAVIGTPGYMAPEQAVGGQVDHRVDLYALGVVLWECCTGQQLWQGDSVTEVFSRQLTRSAPSLRGDVPDGLAALLERLLARSPTERVASAATARDELRRLAFDGERAAAAPLQPAATSLPAGVKPTGGDVTLADVRPGGTAASTGADSRRPANRRASRGRWFAGAAALVLLGFVAWSAGRGGATPEEPESPETPARRGRATIDELVAEAPAAYADDVRMLLSSTYPEARRLASAAIAGAPAKDAIPEYLRDLAELERASKCAAKKDALARIEAAGDVRALSALKIVARTPKDSCRKWVVRYDCLECLRDDLARVIARFEADPSG
ncbi:serine/threonine protein kinase [Nannocystis exedens]|uniref:Serine/threonine protein kinase n=1 Tax=Nannocystis exedens TaxID=54 RepID=A0A1I2CDE7_9BACT|nr:serine/threonine-protein kinase [Nannocystis exedens]PCC68354.1 Serine/threonine-protein kinase PrkC [Nannocystis exedens]SFE66389.1 serine/threonine protein kinase [Nannocystis exedens]